MGKIEKVEILQKQLYAHCTGKIEKVEVLQEKEKQLANYVLLQELPPPALSKITCKMQLLGGVSFP